MKSKFLLLTLPLLFLLEKSNAQSGLVGCYPLNNNANDYSGNGYSGSLINVTSVPDRFGNPNSAYNFSGNNSYILIPESGFLLNEYTYSAWCRPSIVPTLNEGYTLLSIGGMTADQFIQMGNHASSGPVFGGGAYDMNVIPHGCSGSSGPLVIDNWYHIVFTRCDTMTNFYIDDSLICSESYQSLAAGYMGSNITATIGKRSGTVPQYFVGDIDDIKIFNRVLSSTEIKSLDTTCSFTGIEDFSIADNIRIFPNPVKGGLNIISSEMLKNVKLKIFNLIGEEIYFERMNGFSKQIYLNVPVGIYLLVIEDGGVRYCKKMIISE